MERNIPVWRRGGRERGFTLVELMLVMMIIGILLAILVPTIPAVTAQVRAHQTRLLVTTLCVGVDQFKLVSGAYPGDAVWWQSGAVQGPDYLKSSGAHGLYLALQGPDGYGWRPSEHNVPFEFAPFIESSRAGIGRDHFGRKAFVDTFDKYILYYKARVGSKYDTIRLGFDWQDRYLWLMNRYPWDSQNSGVAKMTYGDTPQHWGRKLTKSLSGSLRYPYNSKTYVIWASGVDKLFGYWVWSDEKNGYVMDTSYTMCDDIANF